ncbi:MAG: anti-sigma factor family protein [Armatimonadota bacterium]|jgi:anti-sigma factor RsiW
MACPQWSEQISAWLDGALSGREREELEAHLEACEACRSAATQLRNLKRQLKAMPVPPPNEGMWNRILRHIRHHARLRRNIYIKRWVVASWFAVAASVAILVTTFLWFRPANSKPARTINTLVSYHADNLSLALSDNPMCHLVATAELSEAEGYE